jgi:hypothetical protein
MLFSLLRTQRIKFKGVKMKETKILELDWARPIYLNGQLTIKNSYTWRSYFEYDAQELIELGENNDS